MRMSSFLIIIIGLIHFFYIRGVGAGGEWDWLPERFIRSVMEVNFFGHVAVTRAFLRINSLSNYYLIYYS